MKTNSRGSRRSLYPLPPLELECMKALWAEGEASVREIRQHLAGREWALAYTTVETIMDRLTRKGVVTRRKVGRAHRYTPVYQKAEARERALAALADHFFDGSRRALVAHLLGRPVAEARQVPAASGPAAAGEASRPRSRERRMAKSEPPLDSSLL